MTQITTRIQRYGFVPARETAYNGNPFNGTLVMRVEGCTQTIRNDVAHRVKPSAPLVLHPTVLDQSWSEIDTYYAAQEYWVHGPSNARTTRSVAYATQRFYFPMPWSDPPLGLWITPLRNQIKNLDISMGETVFEFRETAEAFLRAAIGIRDYVRRMKAPKPRKRKRKGGMNARILNRKLKNVSNSYVGMSLGVMPLVQTAVDSALLLQDRLNLPDFFVLKKFVQKSKSERTTVSSIPYGIDAGHITCDRVSESTAEAHERAVVYVKFRPGKVAGWTMGNPLQVGYELLTLSFVLDWFIPVGAFLSSLDAMSSVESVVGTVSTRWSYTNEVRTITRGPLWSNRYLDGVSGYTVTHVPITPQRTIGKSWKRDVITSIPLPPFPRWKPSPAWGKLMTASAIFHQIRSG